jgi:hypothetical protein
LGLAGPGGGSGWFLGALLFQIPIVVFLLLEQFWEPRGAIGLFIFGLDFLGARLPAGV